MSPSCSPLLRQSADRKSTSRSTLSSAEVMTREIARVSGASLPNYLAVKRSEISIVAHGLKGSATESASASMLMAQCTRAGGLKVSGVEAPLNNLACTRLLQERFFSGSLLESVAT